MLSEQLVHRGRECVPGAPSRAGADGRAPRGSESASAVMSDTFPPRDHKVHGILQARILEWVAFPFSRGSS